MAEDLEECVSDCIISIWRNAGHIRPETFKPYVATAARRKAIDMKQRLTRTRFLPLEEDLIAQGEGVEEAAERSSTKEAVASAVNGLGQPDQEIFVRRYYWGESHKQIAQALGLTERAVEGKLYRGRSKLKELLGGVLGG